MCVLHSFCPPGTTGARSLLLLSLMTALASAQAGNLLTDNELAVVSAGAVLPVANPNTDYSGVSDDVVATADTARLRDLPWHPDETRHSGQSLSLHESAIVVASEARITRINTTHLQDAAQSQLAAGQVVNATRSDVINALNMHTGSEPAYAMQLNQVTQQVAATQRYGSNTPTQIHQEMFSRDEIASSLTSNVFHTGQNAITSRQVHSVSQTDVTIEPFQPEVVFDLLDIGTVIPAYSVNLIPAINIDGTYNDPFDGEWGLNASYSGLTLTGPHLAVNGLYPDGDDLILDVDFNVPSLNMGTIQVEACAGECEDWSLHLGSIGGNNLLPEEGIRLEGMNPLRDMQLNINSGVAMAGQGSLSASDSNVGIYGDLSAHFGASLDFNLDLSDHWWVDDLFGQNTWSHHAELDYEIAIPFSILDFDVDGFTLVFDGVTCLALFGNSDCGSASYQYQENLFSDNSRIRLSQHQSSSSHQLNESASRADIQGGVLRDASAELIVMTDGDLQLASSSQVSIRDAAQQNLQSLNVVNAAATISANSLNMEAGRSTLPASAGLLLNQANRFNQRL